MKYIAFDSHKRYTFASVEDRELPSLRDLTRGPDIAEIKEVSEEAFPKNARLARMAGIYLCWRFGGAKLKEIGNLYGISESGVSQAARRFEEAIKKDTPLEKRVLEIAGELALSNIQV